MQAPRRARFYSRLPVQTGTGRFSPPALDFRRKGPRMAFFPKPQNTSAMTLDFHHEIADRHDKALVIDFGSQVTQLIARRVREAGVYCEIAPFQRAAEAFAETQAQGRDPLGRALLGDGGGLAARAAGDFRGGNSGPRHLLRRAASGRAARGQGRGRPPPRIRPRRPRGRDAEPALRRGLGGRRAPSGLDEPWRPRDAAPGRLRDHRQVGERALRGDRRRAAPLLRRAVPSRGRAYAGRREAHRELPAQDRRAQVRLDHGGLPLGGRAGDPEAGRAGQGALRPFGRRRQRRRRRAHSRSHRRRA